MTKNTANNKNIMAIGIAVVLLLLISGCISKTQPPNTNPPGTNPPVTLTWLAYSPVQAQTNPWQVADIQFVNVPTELERAQAWLSSIGVNYSDAVFIPHDDIVCEALNCPRGDYLLVLPTDSASQTKLLDMGFFTMNEPFVFVKNATASGTYTIQFVNASTKDIFYGGCNDYIPQKLVNGVATPMPPKVCVWEGIPTVLNVGKTISFDAQSTSNGTYHVAIGYGTGCASDQPLSQASCENEKTIVSNTFVLSTQASGDTISMTFPLKQCNTNPWQSDLNEFVLVDDKINFTNWLSENGITPLHVSYASAPEGLAVCLACSCPSGETYRIIVSSAQQTQAEALGFEFEDNYIWPLSAPNYAEATWRMFTPYQCFANKWNVKKEAVRNIERDFELMKIWMEDKGVKVSFIGFIRGYSLSQQCTKASTDRYGVGVLDAESSDLLSTLGFVVAGPNQTKKFTLMEDVDETTYLFKTKFCQAPPWGTPDLSTGNEAVVVERVMQWLADAGIPSYEKPTIHQIGVSATGSCGTDSGLGVIVNVPAWSETHITPYGFGKPSYAFDVEKTQVYPAVEHSSSSSIETITESTVSNETTTNSTSTVSSPTLSSMSPAVAVILESELPSLAVSSVLVDRYQLEFDGAASYTIWLYAETSPTTQEITDFVTVLGIRLSDELPQSYFNFEIFPESSTKIPGDTQPYDTYANVLWRNGEVIFPLN